MSGFAPTTRFPRSPHLSAGIRHLPVTSGAGYRSRTTLQEGPTGPQVDGLILAGDTAHAMSREGREDTQARCRGLKRWVAAVLATALTLFARRLHAYNDPRVRQPRVSCLRLRRPGRQRHVHGVAGSRVSGLMVRPSAIRRRRNRFVRAWHGPDRCPRRPHGHIRRRLLLPHRDLHRGESQADWRDRHPAVGQPKDRQSGFRRGPGSQRSPGPAGPGADLRDRRGARQALLPRGGLLELARRGSKVELLPDHRPAPCP